MADGAIVFDTKMNISELESQLKIIKKNINDAIRETEKLEKKKAELESKANDPFVSKFDKSKYLQEISKINESLEAARKKVVEQQNEEVMVKKEIEDSKLSIKNYENLEKQIAKTEKQLESLLKKQKQLEDKGAPANSKKATRLSEDIANTKSKLEDLCAKRGGDKAKIKNCLKDTGNEIAKNHFGKLADDQEKASKKSSKLGSSLVRLGTIFKLMLVKMAMRAVINGVKEGFKNLVQYSSEANGAMSRIMSSMTQLKNSLATAFAPLLTLVAPILSGFINMLSAVATKIAELFAILTGKGTFIRAKAVQQDYAKSIGGTNKAAKDLNKTFSQTASMDELNIIQKEEKNEGSGSSGVNPKDMFETVKVNKKLSDSFKVIIDQLKTMRDLFVKGVFKGLGDWKGKVNDIVQSSKNLKDELVHIFTSGPVANGFKSILDSMSSTLGIFIGSVGNIGLTIGQNILGGLADYFSSNSGRISDALGTLFSSISSTFDEIGTVLLSLTKIFDVFSSDSAKKITSFLFSMIGNVTFGPILLGFKLFENAFKVLAKVLSQNADKIKSVFTGFLDAISPIFETVAGLLDQLVDKFSDFYTNNLEPLIGSIGDSISGLLDMFLDMWNNHVNPMLSRVSDKFQEVIGGEVGNAIDMFIQFVTELAEAIENLWFNILEPFIAFLINEVGPVLVPIVETVFGVIIDLVGTVARLIGDLINIFKQLASFLSNVFKGDWENAWKAIGNVFGGIWNAILGIFEGIINAIINALNTISVDVPDWVPGIGGKHFGFDFKPFHFKEKVPMLAQGTVVPKAAGMFAAILGDNKNEPEIVSPLSTMKQAVSEVLNENVGNAQILSELQEMVDILKQLLMKESVVKIGDREIAQSNDKGQQLNGFTVGHNWG